jgi:hypothetical protein
MQVRQWLWWGCLVALMLGCLSTPAFAGVIGFPVARLQPLHFRFELTGDSFQEDLRDSRDVRAPTGRALVTMAMGLTSWSEVFARVGTAEFEVTEALFNGNFGPAFGGGVRLRLFSLPFVTFGMSGQYLRFTSNDNDSIGAKVDGKWEEIDVALGLGTKRFGVFEFYGGVAFHHSDVTLTVQDTDAQTALESQLPVRIFLGMNLYPLADFPSGRFLVNYEIRFIGEIPQFTLGVQYAF